MSKDRVNYHRRQFPRLKYNHYSSFDQNLGSFSLKCSFKYHLHRLKGTCCSHFIRLGQETLEVKKRSSKSYVADEIEMTRKEEVRHEVTNFCIHGLGSEVFTYWIFCLLHRTAPHFHVSSPSMCNWQKRNKYKSPTHWRAWLDWTTIWRGRLQGSTLSLRATLCVRAPPCTTLGGQLFFIVIIFLILFLCTLNPSFHLSGWQHSDAHYPWAQSWGICEQTHGLSAVPECMFFHLAIHNNLYHKYTTLLFSLFPLVFPRRSPASWWGIEKATCNQVTEEKSQSKDFADALEDDTCSCKYYL